MMFLEDKTDLDKQQEAIAFAEWMGDVSDDEEDGLNPFLRHKHRWIQACGNSTSWSTEQLYKIFKKEQRWQKSLSTQTTNT
jgi:hypothetical protein